MGETHRPTEASALLPFGVVAAVAWVWLAAACAGEWSGNPDYAHGWIVLPLAAYFLVRRLTDIGRVGTTSAGRGAAWFVLWCGAVLVLPLQLGLQAPLYWRVFPWGIALVAAAATVCCAYLAGGKSFVVASLFPLLFLASGIPWPTALEQPLTLRLMHGVASFLATVLPMAGIPAQQEGTTLVLLNCTVGVEEACSGVRSLQSSVMIALAAGEFFSLRPSRRILLLAAGFLMALASNAARTLVLTVAGIQGGASAMGKVHDLAGLGALGGLAAGIFGLAWWICRPVPEPVTDPAPAAPPEPVVPPEPVAPARPSWRGAACLLAVAAAGYVAAWGWYAHHESRRAGSASLPLVAVDTSAHVQELEVPPILRSGLAADIGSFARVVLPDGSAANGFHFFWDGSKNNAQQFYHRPDSCMPEGGWTFVGPESVAAGTIGALPVEWAALPYEKGGRRGLLLWAAWVDGRQIPFSVNTGSGVQRNNLWRLIANGRRTFSYETAAVLVPYDGEHPPVERAVRVAEEMFKQP